jgi:hypothetical protein
MTSVRDIQQKAATDPAFRKALLADPCGILLAEGIDLPAHAKVTVVEADADSRVLIIPPPVDHELDEEQLAQLSGGSEAQYTEMWPQDVSTVPGYQGGA